MKELENIFNDIDYINIVSNILKNDDFNKIKHCRHHGLTRYDHSLRVSYYSYIVTKKLKLNYTETARGGLLHDFFTKEDIKKKQPSIIVHPYKALENSVSHFAVTDLEKDIIINHMFPTLPHKIPKYLESWIVSIVDKVVATYEFYCSFGRPLLYRYSKVYMMLLLCRF